MANQRMYSKKQVEAAMEQSFQQGVQAARAGWRAWYESLPESLRSQIDAFEVARREEAAA